MQCPQCDDVAMRRRCTSDGVEVETCPECNATWFDRGEIFFFVRDGRRFSAAIEAARRSDPDEPWLEGAFGDELPFLLEAATGGVFVPGATAAALTGAGELTLSWHEAHSAEPVVFGAPNLVLRAVAAMIGLYALLLVIAIVAMQEAAVDVWLGIPGAVAMLAGGFLLGPYILDVIVQWFHSARRMPLQDLPPHLAEFVARTCAARDMRPPRFFVIEDGSPEAFTYGHTPSTARIVISSGLITLLEPQELEAVVGHELGHAAHWDLLLMTAAEAVPLLLAIVRTKLESDADGGGAKKARDSLARIVFAAEIASEYVVLWLSRTREYHADRFGAEAVGSAAAMGRALVKVAYGLAAEQPEKRGPDPRAMSIFDRNAAATLALVTRGATGLSRHGIDESALLGAMKWDLWNPWAFISEISSTHPLVAKRLLHLSAVSERLGEQPWLRFDLPRPESYWDDFAVDVAIAILPVAMCGIAWTLYESYGRFGLGIGITLVGIGWGLKLLFTYPTRWFPEMSVGTLMRRVKVSGVRPIPCRVAGRVIGRGEPGLIWSEDFVLRDDTGLVYVDHRQPLSLWEFLWGLLRTTAVIQGDAIVEGWFRRSPVPYIEMRRFWVDGKVRRSWYRVFLWILAVGLIIGGAVMAWFAG